MPSEHCHVLLQPARKTNVRERLYRNSSFMTVRSPGNQEFREPENIVPSLLSPRVFSPSPPQLCVIVVLCCGQGSQGLSGFMCRCTDVFMCARAPSSPVLHSFLSLSVHFLRLRTGSRFSHAHLYPRFSTPSPNTPPICISHPFQPFPLSTLLYVTIPESQFSSPPSRPSSSPPPSPLRAVPLSLSP